MSAVLDTVRSFSTTLAHELAEAVKAQDRETMAQLDQFAIMLDGAKQSLDNHMRGAEEDFISGFNALLQAREASLSEAHSVFQEHLDEIRSRIDEMRSMLKDGQ